MKIILGAGAAVAVAFAVYARTPECQSVTGVNFVSVAESSIAPGHARAFCYTGKGGEKLRFILARGGDGKMSAVFDACGQCYPYHRGYKISSGEVICRVCGNRYSIGHLSEGQASCIPVALPHREEAGKVRIKTADLEAGRWLF